jgi:uncharacterized lipoprotein YajG
MINSRQFWTTAALAGVLAGCHSFQNETIAVDYQRPETAPATVSGADKVALSFVGVDRRARRTDVISTKEGLSAAQVQVTTDVVDLVRGAVEDDFRARGFRIGAGGLAVTVELLNFYGSFFQGTTVFSGGASTGNVVLTLRVKDSAGLTRYNQTYEGITKVMLFLEETAEKSKASLQKALAEVLRKVNDDQALREALLAPYPGK